MPKWEYMTWDLDPPGVAGGEAIVQRVNGERIRSGPVALALAQAGEDGWELVAATTSDNRYRATLFFKRPKEEG